MAAHQHALALLLLAAACGKGAPAGTAADAALLQAPRPVDAARGTARAAEPDAAPIMKEDVLEGMAAERALAAGATETPTSQPAQPVDATLTIRPDGVGPYALRAPRDRTLALLGAQAKVEPAPATPGKPTSETATVKDARGPYLKLRFLGGRVVAIEVLAARPGLATEAGLALGTTFEAAIDLYGPPHAVDSGFGARLGWTLEDLPGVVLRGAGEAAAGPIRTITVVGPEATAAPD